MYFKMFETFNKNKWRNPILTVYGLELEKYVSYIIYTLYLYGDDAFVTKRDSFKRIGYVKWASFISMLLLCYYFPTRNE